MADLRQAARRAARRYGIDPNLFIRQIEAESGFNPRAVSPAGARGIAQIMPATAKAWGVDPMDPVAALNAAARAMRQYRDQFGSYEAALRAYNAGPGAVDRSRKYRETNEYVRRILGAGQSGSGSSRPGGGDRATVTETVPGVDRSAERKQLIFDYLRSRRGQPGAILALKAALEQAQDTPPRTVTRTAPSTTSTASGGAGGRLGLDLVRALDAEAQRLGIPITARQEPGHAPGGDHDPAVKGATARDYGGTREQRYRQYKQWLKRLGLSERDYSFEGRDINLVRDGVRIQIITRPHGTGPHNHIGIRKVAR